MTALWILFGIVLAIIVGVIALRIKFKRDEARRWSGSSKD